MRSGSLQETAGQGQVSYHKSNRRIKCGKIRKHHNVNKEYWEESVKLILQNVTEKFQFKFWTLSES